MKVTWHFNCPNVNNLPLVQGNCWVYAKNKEDLEIIKAYYWKGYFLDDSGVMIDNVTHWACMDIPEPPEK